MCISDISRAALTSSNAITAAVHGPHGANGAINFVATLDPALRVDLAAVFTPCLSARPAPFIDIFPANLLLPAFITVLPPRIANFSPVSNVAFLENLPSVFPTLPILLCTLTNFALYDIGNNFLITIIIFSNITVTIIISTIFGATAIILSKSDKLTASQLQHPVWVLNSIPFGHEPSVLKRLPSVIESGSFSSIFTFTVVDDSVFSST